MGQYYKTVNIDKQQLLHPHEFGDGMKLMEFGMSGHGTMAALASLLVMDTQMTAPWAGQRVVVAGDYADEGNHLPPALREFTLHSVADGSHLQDEAFAKRIDSLPLGYRQAFEPVTLDKVAQLAHGLGVKLQLGDWRDTVYPHLVDSEAVVAQPEDLVKAFEIGGRECLTDVVSDMLTCLRMSKHRSDVAWHQVTDVQIELNDAQAASAMVVKFQDQQNQTITRRLDFPADQASLCRFFGVAPLKLLER